jgi:hypothetical protein
VNPAQGGEARVKMLESLRIVEGSAFVAALHDDMIVAGPR